MRKMMILLLALMLSASAAAEVLPYAVVYEPETSFPLATTIAWNADAGVYSVAGDRVRPATALVCLDERLSVYSSTGELLSDHISDHISHTAGALIPALYIDSEETAVALKSWLMESGLGDVFVVASHEQAALVDTVAELLYVRGMVDFRGLAEVNDDVLGDIIRLTNGSHAKVALLPESIATKDVVQFLQGRLMTVWVETDSNLKSLLTQYTNGANGILVDDYQAALDALSLFRDDAPSLLRVPNIIGHRGMPSMYVENTLQSAVGAYSAGADAIETDIYLSADDKIFILHDSSLNRLFGRKDISDVSALTLEELQSVPFSAEGDTGVQKANNTPASASRYGYIDLLPSERIPALEDLYKIFKGSGTAIDTEIKSKDPAIVPILRNLVEETGNFNDVFVITFNTAILDEMAKSWPEMSVGALGTEGSNAEGQPHYPYFARSIKKDSAEKAVEELYSVIDRWNATFNPKKDFSYEVAVAGRHRGLTVWPWTYNDLAEFSDAYLKGIYGLTTNYAWWVSDSVRDIRAEDARIATGGRPPLPTVTIQVGETINPHGLELLVLEGSLDKAGDALCMYRLKQELILDGAACGSYYLYSNPFTLTVA